MLRRLDIAEVTVDFTTEKLFWILDLMLFHVLVVLAVMELHADLIAALTPAVPVFTPFASPCMKSGIQLSISANGPSSGTEKCRKERIRSATPDTALATS